MQQIVQRAWHWFQRASRGVQVAAVVVILILTCALCGGMVNAVGGGSGSASSPTTAQQATATPNPTATPKPTATTRTIQYPPATKDDLRGLAAQGDANAITEVHREAVGLTGVCPQPRVSVIVDPSVTGKQLAEDLLAFFYREQLDNPCGSLLLAYHTQSEVGDIYTAGRINFDALDSSGQENIDPNATGLKYVLTLDVGDTSSSEEYTVKY